jgi:F0F1-type ATP synthase epsilon subunit
MKIQLKIISYEKIIIATECEIISLLSVGGVVEIMYGHEPMLIQLKKGDIIYDKENKINIKGGFARIMDNICEIMIDI